MPRFNYNSENTNDKLYKMVFHINRILIGHKLTVWMDQRTLLGAVRSNGLVQWDNGISFGIMETDIPKFEKTIKLLKDNGYYVSKTEGGYLIYKKKPYTTTFIYTYKLLDGKIQKSSLKSRKKWPNQYYYPKELVKLSNYEYGQLNAKGPDKKYINKILNRFFGSNWQTHDYLNGKKIKLTKEELEPGMELYDDTDDEYYLNNKVKKVHLNKVLDKKEHKIYPYKKDIRPLSKTCILNKKCMTNFLKPIGIYTINCDVNKDRFDTFQKYAKKAGLNICREKCVLGKKFTYKTLCEMKKNKYIGRHYNGEAITPIETSIFMSHRNVWQRIVNSCADFGMCLEDDSKLDKNFINKINSILSGLEKKGIDFSILHLWNGRWSDNWNIDEEYEGDDDDPGAIKARKNLPNKDKIVLETGNLKVFKLNNQYNAGLVGYIISKKFAKYLLKKMLPINTAVDIFVGDNYKIGNHLSIQTKYSIEKKCWVSPLLELDCGGEEGTGTTTQNYSAVKSEEIKC